MSDTHTSLFNVALSQFDKELTKNMFAGKPYNQEDSMSRTIFFLRKYYQLPSDDNTSFEKFVEDYDEKMYTEKCSLSPNEALEFFAERGDLKNVKISIEKGASDWDLGLFGAAKGKHQELVEFFIEKGAKNWNFGMCK